MLHAKKKGGICERIFTENNKTVIVRGCPNCNKTGCEVNGEYVPYYYFQCSECSKIVKGKIFKWL